MTDGYKQETNAVEKDRVRLAAMSMALTRVLRNLRDKPIRRPDERHSLQWCAGYNAAIKDSRHALAAVEEIAPTEYLTTE